MSLKDDVDRIQRVGYAAEEYTNYDSQDAKTLRALCRVMDQLIQEHNALEKRTREENPNG